MTTCTAYTARHLKVAKRMPLDATERKVIADFYRTLRRIGCGVSARVHHDCGEVTCVAAANIWLPRYLAA